MGIRLRFPCLRCTTLSQNASKTIKQIARIIPGFALSDSFMNLFFRSESPSVPFFLRFLAGLELIPSFVRV